MVHNCCVYNCHNRSSKDSKITFHSFPRNHKERFDAWVGAVNRQTETGAQWIPSNHHKVCSEHFLESDFNVNTNIRTLKYNSVPSVFPYQPSSTSRQNISKPACPGSKKRSCSSDADGDSFAKQPAFDHAYSTYVSSQQHIKLLKDKIASLKQSLSELEAENKVTVESLRKRLETSRTENKCLKERLKRRDAKCNDLINQLREQNVISEEKAALLDHNFNKETLALIQNEVEALETSSCNHHYSDTIKTFAVTVHFYSPKAYDYLRTFLHLPTPATIRRWASPIKCDPEFSTDLENKSSEEPSVD